MILTMLNQHKVLKIGFGQHLYGLRKIYPEQQPTTAVFVKLKTRFKMIC